MTAIMTYKLGSKSAKLLSKTTGWRRVRSNGQFRNNYNHKIISWGCSTVPNFPVNYIVNKPEAVRLAANKYLTLKALKDAGVPCLNYYTSVTAAQMALEEGSIVFARQTITGRSGQGIKVMERPEDMIEAKLYTEFFPKVREFRVHATSRKVFDFQAKLKRRNTEVDEYVFSYDNGRVFCRQGIELPPAVEYAAVAAVAALGLDFGAVDVGIDSEGNVAVFEVNTSPALEGTTLTSYVNILKELTND